MFESHVVGKLAELFSILDGEPLSVFTMAGMSLTEKIFSKLSHNRVPSVDFSISISGYLLYSFTTDMI